MTTPAVDGAVIAPLGDGTPNATAVLAADAAVSPDTTPPAAEPAAPVEKTPEVLAAEKATAITAAEKAVTDAQTPEDKATAAKALAELKDTPGVAPEKYEAFVLPEGMPVDEAQATSFGELAKNLNLSQLQAQKLVDFEAARITASVAENVKAYNGLLSQRLTDLKADPEIGGNKFDESVGVAKAVITKFGTPKLQEWLNTSEAGSHPELIRALTKIGRAMGEGSIVLGNATKAEAPKSQAERMFPNHGQK